MVSKALAICIILSIITTITPLHAGATNFLPQEASSFTTKSPQFCVSISSLDSHIYETTEFKIIVFDKETSLPVANANVSFILPIIVLMTNQEGVVSFSAPYISKASAPYIRIEYIASTGDLSCTLPLSVKKEGYEQYKTNITVCIRAPSA